MQRASARQAGHVPACRVSDDPSGGAPGGLRDRARLLAQLSAYYRELGWWVESDAHGAVDLCLRRGRDVLLLRAAAEADGPFEADAMRALAEAVAERRVDGGVAVACAGFAAEAIAAAPATVKRLDAAALHGMLGDLPARPAHGDPFADAQGATTPAGMPSAHPPGRRRLWALALLCALACGVACALVIAAHAGARGAQAETPHTGASAQDAH